MRVEQALSILKDKGYKYTGKREDMIRILAKEKRYLSARDMLELMKKEYPSLSFDTIYRNLNLFEQLHILEATQIEEERIFRMACDHGHHHHLICTTCGKTKLVEVCPMDVLEQAPPGFEITGHKFEIYGICEMCGISQ